MTATLPIALEIVRVSGFRAAPFLSKAKEGLSPPVWIRPRAKEVLVVLLSLCSSSRILLPRRSVSRDRL